MQPTVTRDLNIKTTVPLVTPIELVNELPVPLKAENTVAAGRNQVRGILNGSEDAVEARQAFLEKRAPSFKGR